MPLSDWETMARTYRFRLQGNPQEKLVTLKRKAAERGVRFVGDVDRGTFSGMGLSGSYRREDQDIAVTIQAVPFLFTYDSVAAMIESFLES